MDGKNRYVTDFEHIQTGEYHLLTLSTSLRKLFKLLKKVYNQLGIHRYETKFYAEPVLPQNLADEAIENLSVKLNWDNISLSDMFIFENNFP